MADQPTTPSGSRWEPDPDATPTAEAAEPQAFEPDPYDVTDADTAAPTAEERRRQGRHRAVLAGAATAVALGAGAIGFVIGHTTAGDDPGFRQAGFSGQQGGGLGEGQQPPGFGHDGDRDGDHGFGQQPPQGSLDGPSSSNGSSNGAGTTGNPT